MHESMHPGIGSTARFYRYFFTNNFREMGFQFFLHTPVMGLALKPKKFCAVILSGNFYVNNFSAPLISTMSIALSHKLGACFS